MKRVWLWAYRQKKHVMIITGVTMVNIPVFALARAYDMIMFEIMFYWFMLWGGIILMYYADKEKEKGYGLACYSEDTKKLISHYGSFEKAKKALEGKSSEEVKKVLEEIDDKNL